MSDDIKTQNAEFDAVGRLGNAYRNLTMTPIVDDDYPEVRHRYESALRGLTDAMKANGRFPRGVLS